MNTRVFQTLHQECYGRVLSAIRGYVRNQEEAEDVTATAFATAFKNRKTFRGEAAFSTWVHRIAINEMHANSRRKRTVSLDALEGVPLQGLVEPDLLDRAIDRASCCRRLRLALRRIPGHHRRALVDHFVRGYPVKQIAKLQRIPLGTVLSRIFNGKRILREAWED